MSSHIRPIELTDPRVRRAIAAMHRVRGRWLRYPEVEAVDVGFPYHDGRLDPTQVVVRVHLEHKLPEHRIHPDEVFGGDHPDRNLPEGHDVGLDILEGRYEATARDRRPDSGRPDGDGSSGDADGVGDDELVDDLVGDPYGCSEPVVHPQLDRRQHAEVEVLADERERCCGDHGGADDEVGDRHRRDDRRSRYDRRTRTTPLLGGLSVGNPRVSAGTLGAIVWDLEDGWPCILSNWHVLAGSVAPGGAAGGSSGGEPHYHSVAGPEPHYHSVAGPEPHYHAAGAEPHYHAAGAEPHYHEAGPEPHYHPASDGAPHLQVAAVGETVLQPGRFDGGTRADTVAVLTRHRLDRRMDAAIARLTGTRFAWPGLLGLPPIGGSREPRLGAEVYKSGRSTGVTRGIIDGVELSTSIVFPHGEQVFEHQLRIAPHPDDVWGDRSWPRRVETSEPGDSGSVWVDRDGWLAVGLHFGGDLLGTPDSEHSLANPIRCVERELGFSFTPVPQELGGHAGRGRGRCC